MKNGFVIPIIVWIIAAAFAILAISKAGSTNNSGQIPSDFTEVTPSQPSPSPIVIPTAAPLAEADLINPVKEFYSDLSSDKVDSAWNLLSKNLQYQEGGYNSFIINMTPGTIGIQDIYVQDLSAHTVYLKIQESNNLNTALQTAIYTGTVDLVKEDGVWRLEKINIMSDDPIVNCNLSHSGSHPGVKKSTCDQYTDCQLGDKWVFYISRDQCIADQMNQQLVAACGGKGDTKKLLSDECMQYLSAFAGVSANIKANNQAASPAHSYQAPDNPNYPTYTYRPTPQQTNEPYTYTAPTTPPSNNTTTSIPTFPSALSKPKDNGFNTVLPDGIQAHLTPTGRDTYNIQPRNGRAWTGNCYNVGDGYMCGN